MASIGFSGPPRAYCITLREGKTHAAR